MVFQIVIFVLLMVIILWAVFKDRLDVNNRLKKQNAIFQSLVSKRGGSITNTRSNSHPKLHIVKNSTSIDVYYEYTPELSKAALFKYTTIFEIKTDCPLKYSMHIYRDVSGKFFGKIAKMIGMQDIDVNDPDFDEAFVIKSNDESFVLSFLSVELKEMLMAPKWIAGGICINEGVLQFYLQLTLLGSESDYDEFIDAGVVILNRLHQMGVVPVQN